MPALPALVCRSLRPGAPWKGRPLRRDAARRGRAAVTRALAAALATAANPARGGLVREALAAHFPRLVAALEDTLGRVARDTQARPARPSPRTVCATWPT